MGLTGVTRAMVARIAVVSGLVGVLAFVHSPAVAKGTRGFVFDGYFVPGERVAGVELLEVGPDFRARAPYFAFLQNRSDSRTDFGWPSPPLEEAVLLDELWLRFFTYRGEPRAAVRVAFDVPDVPAGLYDVVVCDAGCEHRVNRLGPSALYVVSPTERRLRDEIDSLRSELTRWEHRLARLSRQIPPRLRSEWPTLLSELYGLRIDVNDLEQLVRQPREVMRVNGPAISALAGGLLAAGLVLALVRRSHRRNLLRD